MVGTKRSAKRIFDLGNISSLISEESKNTSRFMAEEINRLSELWRTSHELYALHQTVKLVSEGRVRVYHDPAFAVYVLEERGKQNGNR
jgi:hypothetical protein